MSVSKKVKKIYIIKKKKKKKKIKLNYKLKI